MQTEDELDSILSFHVERLNKGHQRASRNPAAPAARSDPFLDSQDPAIDSLPDDELDALWDETHIDKLELDSGSQNPKQASPFLESDSQSSSEDELF